MTSREDIALQLALKSLDKTSYNNQQDAKTLPYEIYNEIYKKLETHNKL